MKISLGGETEKIIELSARLADIVPTIYMLRGNTAAGKTTALRMHPLFRRVINPMTREPEGTVNTDIYKAYIKKEGMELGRQSLTDTQVHEEGATMARRIQKYIESEAHLSVVIDKRFNYFEEVIRMLGLAEKTGRKIKIFDIDTPLIISAVRVLTRRTEDMDPRTPFKVVVEGFEGVRNHRENLIRIAQDSPLIEYYVLVETSSGEIRQVAEINRDQVRVNSHMSAIYNDIKSQVNEYEVELVRTLLISDHVILTILNEFPASQRSIVQQALIQYKGMTLEQALDEHSKEI